MSEPVDVTDDSPSAGAETRRRVSPPVDRPGERPHRFPGVEAYERGDGFFSSECAYKCGAFLADATSRPARDRLDYGGATSQYGDTRGVGTCPNNRPRLTETMTGRVIWP